MTSVPAKAFGKDPQTFSGIVRDWIFGFCTIISSAILGLFLIGLSFPLSFIFIGGLYGWVIAQFLLVPPIETCVRRMGFSDARVEKTKKAVTYSGAALFAFAYFGSTFLK